MKDLRIVIVSWNAQDYIARCLESLPAACEGLSWDCIVVDNNSGDRTVQVVTEVSKKIAKIDVIVNKTNFGFAYACNQGAAHHSAKYVLLLNADTVCPAGTLAQLVAAANRNPEAGIIGPKLVDPDGSYQPSVHRFPALRDQSLILLKLHHVFKRAPSLQKYFALDLDVKLPQSVDQVMGACFLVRAACWEQLKGLDTLYFIWFEEVDACKRAIQKGWKVWYEPTVAVVHHGGLAFAKVFSFRRQQYFNNSLRKYMKRWHGFRAWMTVTALSPVSLAMSAVLTVFKVAPSTKKLLRENSQNSESHILTALAGSRRIKFYGGGTNTLSRWFVFIVALELVSAVAQGHLILNGIIAVIAGLTVAWLSYKRPAVGLAIVLTELMIGGFGYLLNLQLNIFVRGISLRMILMAGFFGGWGLNAMTAKIWKYWKTKELFILQVWFFVGGMVLGGLIRGLQTGQHFIFQDLNAWLFLPYFIPVLDVAHRFADDLKKQVANSAVAALLWLPIKALLTLYVFTHSLPIADWFYAWVRDTRVGEITPIGDFAYRIFFQSMVYGGLAMGFIFAWWIEKGAWRNKIERKQNNPTEVNARILTLVIVTLSGTSVFLSLSRSFWLGLSVGIFSVAILGLKSIKNSNLKTNLFKILKAVTVGLATCVCALGLIFFVWRLPIPDVPNGSIWDLFTGRASTNDPATASRWNLWPAMWQKIASEPILGHGLGSTVTYRSQDPRVLQTNPDGMYTTNAFEWGWLSFWIKFGIFGILIMGWLMVSIAWRVWKSDYDWWIRVGVVGGTVAISVIHFWTPYLDHPLGLAWIIGIEGLLAVKREEETPHVVLL
ncbi:MAG: glycosyltransferase [Patescibacteria group bacterium]|nr:glycosyltransferase [Patescibacteria group bacterium]